MKNEKDYKSVEFDIECNQVIHSANLRSISTSNAKIKILKIYIYEKTEEGLNNDVTSLARSSEQKRVTLKISINQITKCLGKNQNTWKKIEGVQKKNARRKEEWRGRGNHKKRVRTLQRYKPEETEQNENERGLAEGVREKEWSSTCRKQKREKARGVKEKGQKSGRNGKRKTKTMQKERRRMWNRIAWK